MNRVVPVPRDIPDHPVSAERGRELELPSPVEAGGRTETASGAVNAPPSTTEEPESGQDTPAASRPPSLSFLSPLLPIRAARQNIASYAHLYGAVVTRFGTPIETIEPAALCRIIRTAVETAHEGRRERAEIIARALALSIITAEGGPLRVPRTAFDLLKRLSRQSLVARHVNGVAPDDGVAPDGGVPPDGGVSTDGGLCSP